MIKLRIGIVQNRKAVYFNLSNHFTLNGKSIKSSLYQAVCYRNHIKIHDSDGTVIANAERFLLRGSRESSFTIHDVTIGVQFHWQRQAEQTFQGDLELVAADEGITLINHIFIENYLMSVISSEMSASCPLELLKAHAVISRSWALAQLNPKTFNYPLLIEREDKIIRWYEHDSHTRFDLCADDHCQRYQGITNIFSDNTVQAVKETEGLVLVYNGEICDTRFSKCCGGITENYSNTWVKIDVPYLRSVVDYNQVPDNANLPLTVEKNAANWIRKNMPAYCNLDAWHQVDKQTVVQQILPSFDQETPDFYRWTVTYSGAELEQIIKERSGINFGRIKALIPLERGESGRIVRLQIKGTKKTVIVGKELEIRKWLSKSHLYSSSFVVETQQDYNGVPLIFTFHGAGWGHGVGLCQIGAAVMALQGKDFEQILMHYFPGTLLKKNAA